ncbi:MAG: cysteine peptidase family C39 domain-containing protein [Longimicrobiaceae bacterium]
MAGTLAIVTVLGTLGIVAATSQPTPEPVAKALAWELDARYLGRRGVQLQRGKVDCGVAALAMILTHHRREARLDDVRREVLDRGEGLSLLEMQEIALEHGLAAEGWRLDASALAHASLPAIAHFQDHYVVVDEVRSDGSVLVRDPAIGWMEVPASRFQKLWTGNVLLFPAPPTASPTSGSAGVGGVRRTRPSPTHVS